MKIRFRISTLEEVIRLAEYFITAGVKDGMIEDMEELSQVFTMYRELQQKEKRYRGKQGEIRVHVPDDLFAVMIDTYGFQMIKENELDIDTMGELCDIYMQVKTEKEKKYLTSETKKPEETEEKTEEGYEPEEEEYDEYPVDPDDEADEDTAEIGEILPSRKGAEEAEYPEEYPEFYEEYGEDEIPVSQEQKRVLEEMDDLCL